MKKNSRSVRVRHIGAVLKEIREEIDISQSQVERLSGGKVRQAWLSSVEDGNIDEPSAEKLLVLCDIYGITLRQVYNRVEGKDETYKISEEHRGELMSIFAQLPTNLQRVALRQIEALLNSVKEDTTHADQDKGEGRKP